MPLKPELLATDAEVVKRLKDERMVRGGSFADLAIASGVSEPTLRKLERGGLVSPKVLEKARAWLDGGCVPRSSDPPLRAQLNRIESLLVQVLSRSPTT
jgi:transcriptional regulator with XRE-family HTH domain